jgi:hypothetical protein
MTEAAKGAIKKLPFSAGSPENITLVFPNPISDVVVGLCTKKIVETVFNTAVVLYNDCPLMSFDEVAVNVMTFFPFVFDVYVGPRFCEMLTFEKTYKLLDLSFQVETFPVPVNSTVR